MEEQKKKVGEIPRPKTELGRMFK